MTAVPYKVCVIVDREFGERLAEIEPGVPVWIVDGNLSNWASAISPPSTTARISPTSAAT
jgi:hypothetical protein